LLEREPEVRALESALRRLRAGDGSDGSDGQIIVIEGGAGTGKSSLLGEAVTAAQRAEIGVLRARGGELEREQPFGLLRQLFEPRLRRLDPHTRAELLSGAAAPAARLLGLSESTDALADGFTAANAVFWLLTGLSARGPLLVAVDDAHWGDASSLQVLEHVTRRIGELGVALLVAFRPDEPDAPASLLDALRQSPGALQLRPGPLSAEAVSALLAASWPEVRADGCAACHEATGGNPLLLAELLRALPASETPTREMVVSVSVASLEERVLRRAGRVAPQAPALARAMAVLGDGGRVAVAAQLAGLDPSTAGSIAHGLRRIEVLGSEEPFSFVHPLVRRSVYDGIPLAERNRLHERAAELLVAGGVPPEGAVAHLTVLPPAGAAHVASMHLRAAEAAMLRAAPAEAARLLERALQENAPEPPRAVLLAHLGLARAMLRDPGCIAELRAAYDTLEDPELRRLVAVELGYTLALSGAWERAAELIERAGRDLADDPEAAADIAAMRASLELHDARRVAGFDSHRAQFERIAREGDNWGANATAAIIGNEAAYRGRIADARAELALAQRDGRLINERGGGGWAMPMLLSLPIIIDDLDLAEELIADTERAARQSGSTLARLSTLTASAWLRARRGDLIGAEADLTTVLALGQETGMAMLIANIALYLIDVLIERTDAAPAGAAIESTPVPPEFMPTWSGAMLIEARGRLRLARGARAAAIEDLREAGRTSAALGFGPVISGWRSALALAVAGEAPAEALELAEEDLRLARDSGLARPIGVALRTLGVVRARADAGIEALHESVTVLADGPSRLEHARSLVALGGALRRGNQPREARSMLSAGLDLAILCGAERLTDDAQQELLAAGGRRRRREQQGIESLTASELRVAKLAAGGLSNVEIAQNLFVSVKTVESHLAHVYGKFGLAGSGSRWRLAGLLEGDAG
jgi:DNA-binding CsgD family transcriptional regulator/mono/diheme cytochrome c family protein